VGWDFGHPERYETTYRQVVRDFAPGAAAELGLTHVAFAPGEVPAAARPALDAFLARCDAVLLASWGDPGDGAARALYRISPTACGGR
jgi:hypothetical protein